MQKSDTRTEYKAEVSTQENSTSYFYLKKHLHTPSVLNLNNDSFSFNKKDSPIFNPGKNFSCLEKDTPKFQKSRNVLSQPSENIVKKLIDIKNRMRYEKNYETVMQNLNHINNPRNPSRQVLYPCQANMITPRKVAYENIFFNIKQQHETDENTFSRNKRWSSQTSNKNKKPKKSPKIVCQKHLEFLNSKTQAKKNPKSAQLNCFFQTQRAPDQKLNSHKSIAKPQRSLLTNSVKPTTDVWKLIGNLKEKQKNNSNQRNNIKAKQLPKGFQDEFRNNILNSFKKNRRKSMANSQREESFVSSFQNQQSQIIPKADCLERRRINNRYQSASKFETANRKCNLFAERGNVQRGKQENHFLMQEFRFMMDIKGKKSTGKKTPLMPAFNFRA